MVSVETVLVEVLKQIGLEIDSPQVTSDEIDIVQVVSLINDTGKDLAARFEWSKLFASLTVAASVSAEALPSDYLKLAESTPVRKNGATFAPIWRASSPDQWALLQQRPSAQAYFYIEGGNINFSPATDADGAVVRYLSKNWCESSDVVLANGNTVKVPERCLISGTVYRWRRQKNMPFDDFMAEHEADILDELKMDRGQ